MADQNDDGLLAPAERDLRLDLVRGIGQWMVFLDHIPYDIVSWLTLRNYGFSDAAEFFVFISGYTAGFVYGPAVANGQLLAATKRLLKRAWHLYVAHIFLFLFFVAQIARAARRFDNPMYGNEYNIFLFLEHPDVMIGQTLMLKFKPVDLDVLPLYIVLVLALPAILWGLVKIPRWTLLGSSVLYVLARYFDWNLPSFPGGNWYFNPFAWQLLFVFGTWCGLNGAAEIAALIRSRAVLILALVWIAFSFLIVMTWHLPALDAMIPKWMIHVIYPIDKSDLDMFRLIHFLALAVVFVRYVPRNWPALRSNLLRPLVLVGQHSLPIFCLGVFLSFAAHWFLVQIEGDIAAQIVVSVAGMAAMVGVAWVLDKFKALPDHFAPRKAAAPETA
ncbi:OpgC domain-containing protein [Bradyrhizobium sp. Ash2021]|uniref:OpgC domain-containing protein n=1 Tax=Bradyrhizobium sp. Ash2021 TaxID=2954771 RepID=UPI002815E30B|nr:OpgC domain-containing protein [Bradyrhizobium sp. Ash2021]WMT77912.1 OpgC domain-containing protein [Bradyrhizobium sp. Ash2021]